MVFRRASSAMLVTSLTSAVAFSACILSDIMPIRAFGLFSTIIVPVVFVLTIFTQPINYYVYEMLNCCNKDKLDL
jgi:predicted RND superfamily exporter protein